MKKNSSQDVSRRGQRIALSLPHRHHHPHLPWAAPISSLVSECRRTLPSSFLHSCSFFAFLFALSVPFLCSLLLFSLFVPLFHSIPVLSFPFLLFLSLSVSFQLLPPTVTFSSSIFLPALLLLQLRLHYHPQPSSLPHRLGLLPHLLFSPARMVAVLQ